MSKSQNGVKVYDGNGNLKAHFKDDGSLWFSGDSIEINNNEQENDKVSGLQVAKLWIPKEHLAEKFGVEENEFAVTKVESLSDGLELTLCFDSKVENENLVKLDSHSWDIRRVRIDDLNGKNDGLKLYDKDGNLTVHISSNGNALFHGTITADNIVGIKDASQFGKLMNEKIKAAEKLY